MVTIRTDTGDETLTWEDWEAGVSSGRISPATLVNFEPVTGDRFEPAETLGMYQSLREQSATIAEQAWADSFRNGAPPWVTALLVGVQVTIWWIMTSGIPIGAQTLDAMTLQQRSVLEDGEVWRILTAGLAHWTFVHITSNMVMLAFLGWTLERAIGRINLVAIFVLSVFGGSLLSMWGAPQSGSLGASGGVLGVFAAAAIFGIRRFSMLSRRNQVALGISIVPYLALVYGQGWLDSGTDNFAHTGGLIVGALLGAVLDPPTLRRHKHWNHAWYAAGGLTMLSVLAATGVSGGSFIPTQSVHSPTPLRKFVEEYRPVEWTAPVAWVRVGAGFSHPVAQGGPRPWPARTWAVRELERASFVNLEQELIQWASSINSKADDVEFLLPERTSLAGYDGLYQEAEVRDEATGEVWSIQRWTVSRGFEVLSATLTVEKARKARFSSLQERLLSQVVWNDREALIEAKRSLERSPSDLNRQNALAEQLIISGKFAEAEAIWNDMTRSYPELSLGWVGLIRLARADGELSSDDRMLIERALQASDDPDVIVEASLSAQAVGERHAAIGILETGWGRHPGQREIKKSRKFLGLPNGLVDQQPAHWSIDPTTGGARPEPLSPPDLLRFSFEKSAAWGQELERRRLRELRAILAKRDRGSVARLLLLRDGGLPSSARLQSRAERILIELREMGEGHQPRWVPNEGVDALTEWVNATEELRESMEHSWLGVDGEPSLTLLQTMGLTRDANGDLLID